VKQPNIARKFYSLAIPCLTLPPCLKLWQNFECPPSKRKSETLSIQPNIARKFYILTMINFTPLLEVMAKLLNAHLQKEK
jgi:hypothetical protein